MWFEDFMDEVSSSYATFSESDKGVPSACFCVALDHWERVRSQHGYRGLVALLNRFVELVEAQLDVEVCVSRLNERSIVGLLPQSSTRTAEKQLTKLFDQMETATFDLDDESMAVSVTIVWTEFDHRFIDADRMLVTLVKGAERTSTAGGNQLIQIRPDVSSEEANGSDRQMLGLLMEFVRKDELKVYFQPIMATDPEPAKSFQALPRLISAEGSLIPAAAFVPAAREAGVLNVLDRWMLSHCASLLANEYQLLPIRLFLSQGDSLIQDQARRDWLANLAEHNSSLSGKLALDFNIQDALSNIKGARKLFRLLDDLGIEVCVSQVDEHSRWNLLVDDLPADFVKMSADFVQRLASDGSLESVFREISTPVRKRGAKIIMPMVEDASMAANLWRVGADYMQGFMIQEAQERLDLSD